MPSLISIKSLEHSRCNHGGDRHAINTSDHFRAGVMPLFLDQISCRYSNSKKNDNLCFDPYSCVFYFYSRSIVEIRRYIKPRSKISLIMIGFENYMYKDDVEMITQRTLEDHGIQVYINSNVECTTRIVMINRMLIDSNALLGDIQKLIEGCTITENDFWVVPVMGEELSSIRLNSPFSYSRVMLGIATGSRTNMFCLLGGPTIMYDEPYWEQYSTSLISWYDYRVRGMRLYDIRCRDCDMIWNFCRIPYDDDYIDAIIHLD